MACNCNTLVHRHRLEEKTVCLDGLLDACPVTTPKLQLPVVYDLLVRTSPRLSQKFKCIGEYKPTYLHHFTDEGGCIVTKTLELL